MAVDVRVVGSRLERGDPHPLFETGLNVDAVRDQFAVTPDGQRFLLQVPVLQGEGVPITVVLNWTKKIQP
jgi:hypothetical protein